MTTYQVHYCPPKYPEALRPFTCRHEPQFVMHANLLVNWNARRIGDKIEVDHSICLACGKPQGCTYGGNLLADLLMCWARWKWHAQIGARIIHLRERYARIAVHLFGPDGWNGRHERVARLIDPNLTMKLCIEEIDHPSARANGHCWARINVDPCFLREGGAP